MCDTQVQYISNLQYTENSLQFVYCQACWMWNVYNSVTWCRRDL